MVFAEKGKEAQQARKRESERERDWLMIVND
jgi:hypothetical protein